MQRPPKSDLAPAFDRIDGQGLGESEIELGYVAGVFGVRGELRLHLHHRESDFLRKWRRVIWIDPQGARYRARLKARSGAGKRVLGTTDGCDSPEKATALKGWRFAVPRDQLPRLDDDEFYFSDLIGADVYVDDHVVGKVLDVHSQQEMDVLEIDFDGVAEFVPCIREFVVGLELGRVDLSADALPEDE